MNCDTYCRDLAALKERYENLVCSVRAAEKAAGRKEGSVMILPAVKYADARQMDFLARECGVCDVGENRIQTMLAHIGESENPDAFRFHVIGSLQKNKVKYAVGRACLIQSVDSEELAGEIQRICEKKNVNARVLIEINSGREESKTGVSPDEAGKLSESLSRFGRIELCGFMTMGPKCDTPDAYYKYFTETYKLSLDIWQKKLHNIGEPILSMGMSDSFVPAIAAGASCIRVGRALFGPTPAAPLI